MGSQKKISTPIALATEILPEKPTLTDESKINQIIQGPVKAFPGNSSLMQYFSIGLAEGRIPGEKTALIEDEATTTFNRLNDISNRIAETLKAQIGSQTSENPDGDTVIGFCIPPSDKLIFTMFAILKLGAAYVPFDVDMPKDRIVRIVKDCKPVLIVSDSCCKIIQKFDPVKGLVKVVGYSDIMKMVENNRREPEDLEVIEPVPGFSSLSDRTAMILYTSGSTGVPKGVRLSHRAILNRLNWQWQVLPFTPTERWAFKTSITFVDSVSEIFGSLLQGYPTVIFSKAVVQNQSVFIQRLNFHKATIIFLVPSLMKAIFQTLKTLDAEKCQNPLTNLRLWMTASEVLQKDLVYEFFQQFPTNSVLVNLYGATELSDVTCVIYDSKEAVHDKSVDNQIPIGAPLYNTIIYILNDKMELVPENTQGKIFIAGYNLAEGYVEITDSDKFVKNPFSKAPGFSRLYSTGDFGRIAKTRNGTRMVLYEGRTDAQVKVRGHRVNLTEIQYALNKLSAVINAVVLCYHPGLPDQEIVAFLLAEPGTTTDTLRKLLKEKLRECEMPVIRIVPQIPLLINGKTDRQLLLQNFQQEREQAGQFDNWDSLRIPKEHLVAAKVLVETISQVTARSIQDIVSDLEESFYNVGGTSLNSIEVILKLREHKYSISIADFVGAKCILEIVECMVLGQNEESDCKKTAGIYAIEMLTDSILEDVVSIIGGSFIRKGDLDAYNGTTYQDYNNLLKSIWTDFVQKGFSFILRRVNDQQIVGASLNFDAYDEPHTSSMDLSQALSYDVEMTEIIESRQMEKLPRGKGKLIHSFLMGTSAELDGAENVKVVLFMEENIIKMANKMNFHGILTTNTNPLTKAICRDIHRYEDLEEFQVNQYYAPDGTKPFLRAPDSLKIMCCWKNLSYP